MIKMFIFQIILGGGARCPTAPSNKFSTCRSCSICSPFQICSASGIKYKGLDWYLCFLNAATRYLFTTRPSHTGFVFNCFVSFALWNWLILHYNTSIRIQGYKSEHIIWTYHCNTCSSCWLGKTEHVSLTAFVLLLRTKSSQLKGFSISKSLKWLFSLDLQRVICVLRF